MRRLITTFFFSVCLTGAAQAATISESDFAGGFASPNQNFNPTYTAIGLGFDQIDGTSRANNFDFIQFSDLNAGAQTVSLTFNILTPNANAFGNAGGQVRYSTVQTTGPYTNNQSAGFFNLQAGRNIPTASGTQSLSFNLADTFAGGDLFVNILQTYGNRQVAYSLSAPGNLPSPVPLPPAGVLLVAAIGFLGLRGRARARDLHLGAAKAT